MVADVQNVVASWYDFLLQQLVAECYLEGIDLRLAESDVAESARLRARMANGNNREPLPTEVRGLTRFADGQVDEVFSRFQILHQWSDDANRTANAQSGEPGYLELDGQ